MEFLLFEVFFGGVADADVLWDHDGAGVWGPPEDGLIVAVPGEDAAAVGEEEAG